MTAPSDKDKIIVLLAQGKRADALRLIQEQEPKLDQRADKLRRYLEKAQRELDQTEDDLRFFRLILKSSEGGQQGALNLASGQQPNKDQMGAVIDKKTARIQILAIAKKIAESTDYPVSTDAVEREARGLGVPLSDSPGTQIGNILHRSPDWERVSKGVFRLNPSKIEASA